MQHINRREFIKKSALAGLAVTGSLTILGFGYGEQIPKIREDLYNDSEEILLARMIFGEGRGCENLEKAWIALTPINRMHDGKLYNGEGNLKDVLLKREKGYSQYSCFSDYQKNGRIYENFKRVLNPEKYNPKSWERCKLIAKEVLKGKLDFCNKDQKIYIANWMLEKWEKTGETPEWVKRSEPIKGHDIFKHQFYTEA